MNTSSIVTSDDLIARAEAAAIEQQQHAAHQAAERAAAQQAAQDQERLNAARALSEVVSSVFGVEIEIAPSDLVTHHSHYAWPLTKYISLTTEVWHGPDAAASRAVKLIAHLTLRYQSNNRLTIKSLADLADAVACVRADEERWQKEQAERAAAQQAARERAATVADLQRRYSDLLDQEPAAPAAAVCVGQGHALYFSPADNLLRVAALPSPNETTGALHELILSLSAVRQWITILNSVEGLAEPAVIDDGACSIITTATESGILLTLIYRTPETSGWIVQQQWNSWDWRTVLETFIAWREAVTSYQAQVRDVEKQMREAGAFAAF